MKKSKAKQMPSWATNDKAVELEQLKEKANQEHANFRGHQRDAIRAAKRAGDYLQATKDLVGHGNWSTWIANNFDGSERTARIYMRVSKEWGTIEPLLEKNDKLTLEDVRRILRKAPPEDGKACKTADAINSIKQKVQTNFSKSLSRFPEKAIETLADEWEVIWEGLVNILKDNFKIVFDDQEIKLCPSTLNGINKELKIDENDDWNKTNISIA